MKKECGMECRKVPVLTNSHVLARCEKSIEICRLTKTIGKYKIDLNKLVGE